MLERKHTQTKPGWALITGASSGIGYAIAEELIKKGHDLVLVAQNKARLSAASKKLKSLAKDDTKIIELSADLTKKTAPAFIYKALKTKRIRIELLINNAGIGNTGPFHRQNFSQEENLIKVNLLSLVELSHLFLEEMVKRGSGTILNVASVAAFIPGPLMATYYASKAFVLHFSEALYAEVKASGVLVSVLCPGPVPTRFHKRSGTDRRRLSAMPGVISAPVVARAACRGIYKKKAVIVPGLIAQLSVLTLPLLPRAFVRRLLFFINSQK